MSTARAAFLSRTRPVRPVTLPDGTTVYVRALTLAELGRVQARYQHMPVGPDRDEAAGLWLCTFALCEADGTPFFADPTDADLDFIQGRPAVEVNAIAGAAGELNSANKDAAKN